MPLIPVCLLDLHTPTTQVKHPPLLITSSLTGPPVASWLHVGVFAITPLNISDHLPLCISLHVTSPETDRTNTPAPRIHWKKAVSTGVISEFAKCLDDCILPYLNFQLEGIGHLDQEIQYVCDAIHNIAKSFYTGYKKAPRNFFNHQQLKHLCKASKLSLKECWKAYVWL